MNSLTRILRSTRQLWPYYVMIIVASTATALLNLAAPFLIKAATDVIVDAINQVVLNGVSPADAIAAAAAADQAMLDAANQ